MQPFRSHSQRPLQWSSCMSPADVRATLCPAARPPVRALPSLRQREQGFPHQHTSPPIRTGHATRSTPAQTLRGKPRQMNTSPARRFVTGINAQFFPGASEYRCQSSAEIKVRALKEIKITAFHLVKYRFICFLANNAHLFSRKEDKCLICS